MRFKHPKATDDFHIDIWEKRRLKGAIMGNEIVQVATTPSWVEIAMFAVTTLYLVATIGVFIANRKMAKAAEDQIKVATKMAELSRNVELYDKRMELIEYVNKHYVWEICRSKDFQIKLTVLFSDCEIISELSNLKAINNQKEKCNSEKGIYLNNSKGLPVNYLSLSSQIENALKKSTDQEEIQRVRKLAGENTAVIKKGENESKQLNLFDIIERYQNLEAQCENSEKRLIGKMTEFIENTILV